jgi:hypothetical protein
MSTRSDEFGPWKAEKHEEKTRGWLVVRHMISSPGITRYFRAAGGAPIWYTLAGAEKRASALNEEEAEPVSEYPTWVEVAPGHWESEEQMDGTPDFIAIRTQAEGWWLKWRSSAQPTAGFRTIGEVKDYVRGQVAEMDARTS